MPEFDSSQVDPDLHKRMNKAVEDGRIKCFNMRESNLDGDQDLNFWTRDIEDLVREIMEDPIFKFQIGQLRYDLVCTGLYQHVLVCTCLFQYIHMFAH